MIPDLTIPELTYVAYIGLSVGLTVWVGRTLHKNGRVFLVDAFKDEALADSVNHLLVVGFYLINFGYDTLVLKYGDKPETLQGAFEFVSTKVGLVLLVLGVVHFFNLYVFSLMRRKGMLRSAPPPVRPHEFIAVKGA